jgi:hypothetical protein
MEHPFVVSIKGSSYTRLNRALQIGKLSVVSAEARDLPHIELDDALEILVLMARARHPSFDRLASLRRRHDRIIGISLSRDTEPGRLRRWPLLDLDRLLRQLRRRGAPCTEVLDELAVEVDGLLASLLHEGLLPLPSLGPHRPGQDQPKRPRRTLGID